jgi:peptidoglycan/xylan/chitin deacetylase (PgdA/CDA1 family)
MVSFKLRLIREQNRLFTFLLKLLSLLQKGPEIYLFHDIVETKQDVKSDFALSQQSFEYFLTNQLVKGKKTLTHYQLSQVILKKQKADKHSFYVTFDDCNTSVFTQAYPFLKKNKIPFLLFITKDLIGKKNFLTSEQIMILAKDPLCTIGSHAVNHVMFRYLQKFEAEREYLDSQRYLQQLSDQPVDCFAFPYGRLVEVSCENIKLLTGSVYKFGFSAISGNLNQQWLSGKYYLPRVNVSEKLVSKQ